MARYLAIDLDPEGLFVVAGTARGGTARVEHALSWVAGDEHGPPPLSLATAKGIGEQLRDRLKAANILPAPVLFAIGRDKIILKELRYPPVPPTEEPALVRFQTLKEITDNPDEVIIDYVPSNTPDANGDHRATAVIVRKEVFAAVQALCTAAGLKLAAVTPRPFATAAGLNRMLADGSVSPSDSVAVLTFGSQSGEFTVVRNGHVAFARAVPAPMLANPALLTGEVRRNLTVYGGQSPAAPVREIRLAEAPDLLGGWAERLRAGLPVPLHEFDPVAGAAEDVPAKLRGRFAGAAGLLAARAAGLPINFTAPRQPVAEVNPHRKLFIFAGAAAALFLLICTAIGYSAVNAANREYADIVREKKDLEDTLNQVEPDRKRLDAADQWAGRSVNYLDELFDLTDRMPASDTVRVTKFEAMATRVDKNGKQDSQATMKLHVGAKNGEPASALMSAIDRDNTAKTRYYTGTRKTTGGLGKGEYNQLFTIETKVNHRPPTAYTRSPAFSPPPRPMPVTTREKQ